LENRENKMGSMPVGKLLLNMSAPMVASMLFQAFYNIVDSIVVSKVSQDALNAVSLAFPMQMLLIAFSTGTGVGMCSLISRFLGEKDRENANKAANTGIFVYIITAIAFMIIGWACAAPYYRVQTDNAAIIMHGTNYINVCVGLSFALFGQMCFERLLQSTGRTDLAMIPQLTGAIINIILDPIMTLGLLGFPRLEVKGAAIATVIGQTVAACIGIILNLRHNKEIRLSIKEIRPHQHIVGQIYSIGIPSIVMQAIGSIMNFGMNMILISFTEAATAVFGVYYKLQSFIFMPVFGINNAYIPIVSFNFGAQKSDRVKKAMKYTIITAMSIMIVGCLVFELFPGALISIFSPSEEMIQVGIRAFRVIGVHFPLAGFCIIAASTCQALGKPQYSLITSVCRQLVVLLPSAYLLSLSGNLDLVWLAFPIAEVFSVVLSAIFLNKTVKVLE